MNLPPFQWPPPLPRIRWSDLRPAYLKPLAAQAAAQAWAWCLESGRAKVRGKVAELWQAITAHRIRSLITMAVATAVLLATLKAVPAMYGRYALQHAAGVAARQSLLKGEDRVVLDLRRRAFDLGLMEAVLEPGVFHLEPAYLEGGPACEVSYDFLHRVDFYGLYHLSMRYQAKVVRLQVSPQPNAVEGEESRSVPDMQQ